MQKHLEIVQLKEVDSTNDYMKRLHQKQITVDGCTVIAEEQKNGKGQRGKSWESESGKNLLFTFFSDNQENKAKEQLSFAVSVALVKLIDSLVPGEKATVKWPNDVLVNGDKIAGILIENRFSGTSLAASFIGIGLNVNQELFPRFTRPACSLKNLTGVKHQLLDIASQLKVMLTKQLNKGAEETKKQYDQKLYLRGMTVPFLQQGKQVLYTVKGVSMGGKLELCNAAGELFQFDLGELKFLR
jgi:BirA family transcriptional regulator, biotin operon repressor / biotin---[acetyl-CoA-carboxylase] ligase